MWRRKKKRQATVDTAALIVEKISKGSVAGPGLLAGQTFGQR
jgi:hypothetical protein